MNNPSIATTQAGVSLTRRGFVGSMASLAGFSGCRALGIASGRPIDSFGLKGNPIFVSGNVRPGVKTPDAGKEAA